MRGAVSLVGSTRWESALMNTFLLRGVSIHAWYLIPTALDSRTRWGFWWPLDIIICSAVSKNVHAWDFVLSCAPDAPAQLNRFSVANFARMP